MIGNLARAAAPDALTLRAMGESAAQPAQAKRLSEDVGVDRNVHHQWMALGLLEHLVELIDHHVGETAGGMPAVDDGLRIVGLDGIGHREDRP
jgi:hypothetical protein